MAAPPWPLHPLRDTPFSATKEQGADCSDVGLRAFAQTMREQHTRGLNCTVSKTALPCYLTDCNLARPVEAHAVHMIVHVRVCKKTCTPSTRVVRFSAQARLNCLLQKLV